MISPAFRFYPQDFLVGSAEFTAEEAGIYIRLLCYQWTKGSIPSDINLLMRLTQGKKASVQKVLRKFEQLPDGDYLNKRLQVEQNKQVVYREFKVKAGKESGKQRAIKANTSSTESNTCSTDAQHEGNRIPASGIDSCSTETPTESNVSLSYSSSKEEETKREREVPSLDDVLGFAATVYPSPDATFCQWWFDKCEASGWLDRHGHVIKKWRNAFRSDWSSSLHRKHERQVLGRANGSFSPKETVKSTFNPSPAMDEERSLFEIFQENKRKKDEEESRPMEVED